MESYSSYKELDIWWLLSVVTVIMVVKRVAYCGSTSRNVLTRRSSPLMNICLLVRDFCWIVRLPRGAGLCMNIFNGNWDPKPLTYMVRPSGDLAESSPRSTSSREKCWVESDVWTRIACLLLRGNGDISINYAHELWASVISGDLIIDMASKRLTPSHFASPRAAKLGQTLMHWFRS